MNILRQKVNKAIYGNRTSNYPSFYDTDVSQTSENKPDMTHVISCKNCIGIEHTTSDEFVFG